jgi:hypothetical protein
MGRGAGRTESRYQPDWEVEHVLCAKRCAGGGVLPAIHKAAARSEPLLPIFQSSLDGVTHMLNAMAILLNGPS